MSGSAEKAKDNSIDLTSFDSEQQNQMDMQSVNSFYKLAQEAFNEKHYRLAIIYLRKILQIDNSFVSAFKLLAKIFQIRKNYKKAAEILRQAVDSNFRDAELHYQLGYIYYLQGNKSLFARECTKALVVNSNFAKAYYALALLNFDERRYDKAQEEAEKCLRLNDHDLEAHFLLARVFIRLREFALASKHLIKILQLNNNYQDAHYYLAGLYFRSADYDKAIEHYLASGVENAKVQAKLAKSFRKQQSVLERELKLRPKDLVLQMDLAGLYFRQANYERADMVLRNVLRVSPGYLPAQINQGLLLVYQNKYLEGIRIYQDVLKRSPANKEAEANIRKAIELAEKYYLQNIRFENSKRDLLEIYMLEGTFDKAVLLMDQLGLDIYAREILQRITPQLASYQIYQGAGLYALGELAEAKYMFEHLAEAESKQPSVYYFLGLLAKKRGNLSEAFRWFEKSKMINSSYWFAENELQNIRKAELARLEKDLTDETKIIEYIDLLIMTGAYRQALQKLLEYRQENDFSSELIERLNKTIDQYEHELEMDLESTDPSVDTFLDLGEIYVHKKRYYDAFVLFQTALQQYPNDEKLKKYFAYLLKKNIEVYEALLPEGKTMVYYNLAIFYALAGRKVDLFKMLEKAVAKDKKLAIQARYEDAFKAYRELDRFRILTLIEGEDKNIYKMQD